MVGSYKGVGKLLDAAVGNGSFTGDFPVLAFRRSQLLAGGARAIDKHLLRELLQQLLPSLVKVHRTRDRLCTAIINVTIVVFFLSFLFLCVYVCAVGSGALPRSHFAVVHSFAQGHVKLRCLRRTSSG